MLRSLLARPRPLLSHLRRYHTDVDQPAATASACRYGTTDPRQHLYVVLEDWNKGFSIHKFDLEDGSDASGDLALRPPVHRHEKPQPGRWNFAALGNKIVAAGRLKSNEKEAVTLMYDTMTMGLSIAPRLSTGLRDAWTLAAAMDKRLYVLEANSERPRRWSSPPYNIPCMHRLEDVPLHDTYYETCWSWTTIKSPSLPFRVCDVESSALHPEVGGGHTLFVSTGQWERNPEPVAEDPLTLDGVSYTPHTFSYDTGSGEWKHRGEWTLPFYGQAHYNAVLDAWVGLHKAYEKPYSHMADGYVCSCDVVPPEGNPTQWYWKLSTESLFDPDAEPERHLGASLVYTGDMNYCLVQVVARQQISYGERCGHECTLHLSTFRLQYGKNGELTVTAPRPERSYRFLRFDSTDERVEVHAFWM